MATAGNKKSGPQSRSDIVAKLAAQGGLPQTKVDELVRAYEGEILRTLTGGGEVRLAGFGSFKTSKRAARTARNPRTGEDIKVAARTVARFQPAKAIKDALAGPKSAAKAGAAKAGAAKAGAAKAGAAKAGAVKAGAAKKSAAKKGSK